MTLCAKADAVSIVRAATRERRGQPTRVRVQITDAVLALRIRRTISVAFAAEAIAEVDTHVKVQIALETLTALIVAVATSRDSLDTLIGRGNADVAFARTIGVRFAAWIRRRHHTRVAVEIA